MASNAIFQLLVLYLVCFIPATYSNPASRIVNGEKAERGDFPYLVSVETIGHFCGGSILDDTWILTAAHCVQDPDGSDSFPLDQVVVLTDAIDDWYPDGKKYKVDSFHPHEKYNFSDNQRNDIALIKLAEPIEFNDYVTTIDLPTEDITAKSCGMIAGWGATSETPGVQDKSSRWLNKLNVFTIDTQDCDIKYKMGTDRIQDGQVCIHAQEKGESACEGDSGGPLVIDGKIVGVASFVIPPCGGTFPDVYTRVYYFLDWIQDTRANN